MHQNAFHKLLKMFSDNLLLSYFNMTLPTYMFTDADKIGLGAILCQGNDFRNLKPVVIASRCSNQAEKNYPQLALGAMGIDFRFRSYLLGSPNEIVVITDHFPLITIFNGKRSGSITKERIKLRHQDIRFYVIYRKGQHNPADYLSGDAVS